MLQTSLLLMKSLNKTETIDCVGVEQHVNPCWPFCASPREKKKKDRRYSRGDINRGTGKKKEQECKGRKKK